MITQPGLVLVALALYSTGIASSDVFNWDATPSHAPLRPYMVEIEAGKLSARTA